MKKRSFKARFEDVVYDHPFLKASLHEGFSVLIMVFSAFLFAFGFKCFISPANLAEMADGHRLVSGGVSGVAQVILLIGDLCSNHGVTGNHLYDTLYSIMYFGLNVPLFILAWRGIGKRFTILTLMNVGLVSVFNVVLGFFDEPILFKIAEFCAENGNLITRAVFAGVCTGVSSAIAYRVGASAGGMDVIAYYIALKKSTLVGRYSVYINAVTMSIYTVLSITESGWGTVEASHAFVATLFSVVYLIMTMLVVDIINQRNKKVRVEVISNLPDLGQIVMANIPHGATIVKGTGAFTGAEKYIVTVIISMYEVKKTVQIIRNADPAAFVTVVELKQVYGNFFIPPIK
ncbi:MAG: YitT family protein [Bacilli bacterium]|nr:YitT family protein [Bacilli bacterium]